MARSMASCSRQPSFMVVFFRFVCHFKSLSNSLGKLRPGSRSHYVFHLAVFEAFKNTANGRTLHHHTEERNRDITRRQTIQSKHPSSPDITRALCKSFGGDCSTQAAMNATNVVLYKSRRVTLCLC